MPQEKWPLKMNINFCNQCKKIKPKIGAIFQDHGKDQNKVNQAKQRTKVLENVRQNKKQKLTQVKQDRDRQEGNTPTSRTNTTSTKKKTGQNQG